MTTHTLEQTSAYVWLYTIDIPSVPLSKLRLAAYPEALTFERDSAGIAIPYSPFAIVHTGSQLSTDGSLPTVTITAQNVTREMSAELEAYNGLENSRVRIVLIERMSLPDGTPIIDEVFEVLRAEMTESTASLVCGQTSAYGTNFPNRRIARDFCAHDYGGAECGYDTTRGGALQTCSKRKDGALGCTEHGDDEVAAGLPRQHPVRRLIFEGVLRNSGVGVA